jgi:hypothetical protein
MINSFLDIIYLYYIAITESLFVQITTITVFYIVFNFIKNPRPNWYYNEDHLDA